MRRAEALVASVHGVSSCRIRLDESGRVSEVHVVSRAGKSPKLVARDVEGVLKAEMDLDVDYKKIGVVVLDAETETAPPDTAPEEFPILEHASRFAFVGVNVASTRVGLRAEVELSRDSAGAFGSFESDNPSNALAAVAEATLRAVSELLDDPIRLCLGGVLKVSLAGDDAVLVRVDMIGSRSTKTLAGSAMVAGSEAQAVVFATLDAINRLTGKFEFKSSIEYKIK